MIQDVIIHEIHEPREGVLSRMYPLADALLRHSAFRAGVDPDRHL